ncbi:MAG: 1-acyl-sn-glycerol-3-phosphate acyltransferase [Candidatus Marinimicrobia bacterium]|nr:1-acyl-sn-glycerol-3-phosphate acyltransferase [Candidatus Neomarinimicrobiota bacterium]
MKTIREALQNTTLGPEYSYLLEQPSLLGRFIKKLFEIFCKVVFTFYCPVKVEGRENIPESSFILCSNHCSHMDSGVLMVASGLPFKNFGMMAAKEYFFDNKIRRISLNLLMHLIPIDRKTNHVTIVKSLAACRDFTKNGNRNIIIYPEGTRSITGKIGKFKKGLAMVATELGLPVVPVYINGTHDAYPKGNYFMKPKKIYATIGQPIYPNDYVKKNGGNSNKQVYNSMIEEIEKRVHELKENQTNKST